MHPRQPRGGFYASGRDGNFERINSVTKSYYPHKGGFNDGDVFVEAGRLAAEYLVSQGMLPPNVLSLRLNDNCNVVGGVVGGFRKQGESVVEGGGGRASALNRLGNNVDGGMSWRRKPGFEEFGQNGSGRRRGGFRGNGFDWGHDFRRNEYWNDRYRGGVDFKDDSGGGGDDDGVTRERDEEEEQQQEDGVGTGGGGDGGDGGDDALQKLDSNEIVPKSEDGDDLDAEIEKVDCVSGELESEQKSSGAEKDTYNMEMEFGESSIVLENASGEVKEVQERDVARADDDDNMEKSSISKNLSVQSNNQENMSPSRVFTDLISLCKSVKVPTRIRSSRTKKNLKADHHHDDDKDMGSIQGPDVIVENESVKGPSSGDLLSEKTYDLEHTDSDIVKVEPVQDVKNTKEFDTLCNAEEVQPIGFQSREDGGFMHDNSQKSSAVPEYGSCSTMAEERGEKRAAEAGDIREETKRLREWLPVLVPRTGEYFVNSNRIEIKESLGEDEISLIDKVTSSDQESLMSSQFTLGGDKPSLKCSEGKQSLPSSFRTCDLNLIEASEVHENHVDHPTLIYPPGTKAKKDVPVDISLPMSHTSVSGKFSTHSTSGKEIEVIDLENDSAEEEKPVENMERKTDTMFQGLEGFTNHAQNTGDINDVQDGYGLMISELLATDFPNCSSVPSDINSVHNEIDLHNVPEPLIGEDDSIYMSLGEIPLSFLRSWEQPPSQDYQKPF